MSWIIPPGHSSINDFFIRGQKWRIVGIYLTRRRRDAEKSAYLAGECDVCGGKTKAKDN
jgi:hypothetical protein